ncbi:secretion protein EspK [Mycobacterium sp.]|uniref:secretion protein EspK n=1 Tax=Mycobacterium sp. TaxID=1785 RepID=UPI0025EEC2C4|nr:secretion protein EspK [Mycobacterium sp.]
MTAGLGVAKPTGGYAEPMIDPGGWPDVDEQIFYDRAQQYTRVLHQLTGVLETCQHQRAEIFDGGIWSGGAAAAANGELGALIDEMAVLQNGLATVITWHKYVAMTIVEAKSDVTDNVVAAHRTIDALEKDSSLDAAERTQQISTVVSSAHAANVAIVDGTAAQILVSKTWKPPASALQELLDQRTPPPVTIPDTPAVRPSPDAPPRPAQPVPVTPGPVPVTPGKGGLTPPPVTPGTGGTKPPPGTPPAGPPPSGTPPVDGGGLQPTPGTPQTPGKPTAPTSPGPAGPGPAVPGGSPIGGPAVPLAPATPASPLSPAAGAGQPGAGGDGGKGMAPAAASGAASPASTKPAGESGAGAGAGPTGMPAGPMGSGGSGGAGTGSGAKSGGKSGAPVGQKSGDKPPSTRPAATARSTEKGKPGPQPRHVERTEVDQGAAGASAVIPVSAARAERDAIAEAATADAARRAGPDALQLARRVGAALNAPGVGGRTDLGFFWVTGVTTDGAIVVANSYGLAYIPEGVQLPQRVHLASGDETIPPAERARWATYPVMAVRGWADHHDKKLRAVIGTEQQLANSDPGVATIVLQPDDIPETGDMTGRSRLEVVDSEAATLLAATPDARLVDLLPPAPAGAEPANSPADDRLVLWFDVMKPLASKASGRQAAHLRAFQAYAACAERVFVREAHAATDPDAQRSAVADWLYWKHLAALIDAALADPRILSPA